LVRFIGNITHISNKHTGTDFGAFVLVPTGPALAPPNSAPVLAAISDKIIVRGSQLTFTNSATDADLPSNKLTYSLASGAPAGASVNAVSGVFTWQPPSNQIPGTNFITLRVTDNGTPALSDARTFAVVVTDVNKAPVLAAISNRTNYLGSTFSFTASAVDNNLPAQTLTFSLDAPVPAGAGVSPGGLFTWTPSSAQAPSTNRLTMRVADNGIPSLSSTRAFTIVVLAIPHDTSVQLSGSGAINIRWVAVPNKTYQVQYKNSLQDPNWTNLGASLKASSASASITDTTGLRAQRFYRVLVVK
jgi:hypothetical protein